MKSALVLWVAALMLGACAVSSAPPPPSQSMDIGAGVAPASNCSQNSVVSVLPTKLTPTFAADVDADPQAFYIDASNSTYVSTVEVGDLFSVLEYGRLELGGASPILQTKRRIFLPWPHIAGVAGLKNGDYILSDYRFSTLILIDGRELLHGSGAIVTKGIAVLPSGVSAIASFSSDVGGEFILVSFHKPGDLLRAESQLHVYNASSVFRDQIPVPSEVITVNGVGGYYQGLKFVDNQFIIASRNVVGDYDRIDVISLRDTRLGSVGAQPRRPVLLSNCLSFRVIGVDGIEDISVAQRDGGDILLLTSDEKKNELLSLSIQLPKLSRGGRTSQ